MYLWRQGAIPQSVKQLAGRWTLDAPRAMFRQITLYVAGQFSDL